MSGALDEIKTCEMNYCSIMLRTFISLQIYSFSVVEKFSVFWNTLYDLEIKRFNIIFSWWIINWSWDQSVHDTRQIQLFKKNTLHDVSDHGFPHILFFFSSANCHGFLGKIAKLSPVGVSMFLESSLPTLKLVATQDWKAHSNLIFNP